MSDTAKKDGWANVANGQTASRSRTKSMAEPLEGL